MLPNSGTLEDLLFPMSADVYYAQTKQLDYGNISKTWVYSRTISCSIISEMSTRGFAGELKTKGTDFIYDSNAFLRTPDDIRHDENGIYHPITAISITNIKDPSGQYVWINGQNKRLSPDPVNTKYEIKTIVPTFNYDHNLRHWRVYMSKSQNQKWEQ